MVSQWLSWLNCALAALILLLGGGAILFWAQQPREIACQDPISKQCRLPRGAFDLSQEAYHRIGEPILALQSAPPTIQLPDLRQQIIYYGKNGRPDAQSNRTLLHFSLNGNKVVTSITPGEKLYLIYDKKGPAPRYNFSPQNQESSLWIEAAPQEANEVVVKVFMKNDKGEIIAEPEAHAQFKLPEKEFIRYAGATWDIGTWRVDGTLLARQRARWFGPDRFLERHGGEDYKHIANKQRIDFGENDDLYSVFVGAGDCLIWEQNRWKSIVPGEASLNHPLLIVKKVDERLMTFELWDVEGKGKVLLNLLKSTEPWMIQNAQTLQHLFKFVGARTRTQCVFEINRERVLVSPHDWLLMTSKGWKKLVTEQEIEDYVKRKTTGALFVFEELTRKNGKQMMLGTLYNPTRSDCQTVELPLHQPSIAKNSVAREQKEANNKESHTKSEKNSDGLKADVHEIQPPPILKDQIAQPMVNPLNP